MKITKAMILCAGFGKRLRPLTLSTPKPLLKIGGKTLLSNTLKILEWKGCLCTGNQQILVSIPFFCK